MWNRFKQLRIVAGPFEHGKETSLEFVDQLIKCQLPVTQLHCPEWLALGLTQRPVKWYRDFIPLDKESRNDDVLWAMLCWSYDCLSLFFLLPRLVYILIAGCSAICKKSKVVPVLN
jgi:hypothetical protein